MSVTATDPAVGTTGLPSDPETLIRRRITAAEDYRKRFEPQWLLAQAFLAGNQWNVIDRETRRLVDVRTTPEGDRYSGVDLYVADILHEHRGAALGELQTDSDRPELILPGDGEEDAETELVDDQANRLLGFGWDYEWDGDAKLALARQFCVDLGVSAVLCSFDRRGGGAVNASDGEQVQAPVDPSTGRLITDPEKARAHVADQAASGRTAKFEPLTEGCIGWEPGTAFNILAPPSVPHEDKFPYDIFVDVVSLADMQAEYPAARDLKADSDIGSALGIATSSQGGGSSTPRVADSVWRYRYFERPSPAHPQGRFAVLAGSGKRLVHIEDSLPYQRTSGEWWSGIVYLHWQRLTDRFYSRSLVDALKDPQRMTNRVATQSQEIIDRGMPKTFVYEGDLPQKPSGAPGEYVEMKQDAKEPKFSPGFGPGPWIGEQRRQLLEDAAHASTIGSLKLGENPQTVTTYSQLALLNETEAAKRSNIRADHQGQVAKLAEASLQDVRRYWREGKRLLVAGAQNRLQAVAYEKSMLPDGYVVRPAKGAPRPRSQAAQIQLITDLWAAALNSGAVVADPARWMQWLADSYDAGTPLPLPEPPADHQTDMAELENRRLAAGEQPPVTDYDDIAVHVPMHRIEQDRARAEDDLAGWQRFERHIQDHLAMHELKLARQAPPPPDGGLEPPAAGAPVPAPPGPQGPPAGAAQLAAPPA